MALQALKKKESLSDKAFQMLRTAIVTRELRPGEVVAEEPLAKKLGISRTPIRAALLQLNAKRRPCKKQAGTALRPFTG